MQANSAIGDGEAQSYATGTTAASVVDAVKRAKSFLRASSGTPGPESRHTNRSFGAGCTLSRLKTHLYIGTFLGVAGSIANHILDSAVQQAGVAQDHALVGDDAIDGAISVLGFEGGILGDLARRSRLAARSSAAVRLRFQAGRR